MAKFDSIGSATANTNDLLDIITRNTDQYSHVSDKIVNAFMELSKFYSAKSEDESKYPFQFDPKNQHIFDKNASVISMELSNVLPLLENTYDAFYRLDNPIPYMPQYTSAPQNPSPTPETKKDEKKSMVLRLFGGGQKKEIDKNSPYNQVNKILQDLKDTIELWEGLVEFQAYAPDWCDMSENVYSYLAIVRTEFNKRKSRIMTAIDGGRKIALIQEKRLSGQILSSAYQATERHRMDFNPNQ